MLPVVYTPTVGLAIERFSHEFRRPRGVYLSVDHPEDVETALRNTGLGAEDVDLLVATDSEGILGIGDQGVGGIEISDRQARRLHRRRGHPPQPRAAGGAGHGHRQPRAAQRRDVPGRAARPGPRRALRPAHRRLRHRVPEAVPARDAALGGLRRQQRPAHPGPYADQVCTFNDDMQGTAAVVLAAAFSARAGGRHADARPAGGHPRRRHRRAGHRRHDARPDGPRGPRRTRRPPGGSTRWAAAACSSTTAPSSCATSRCPTPARRPRSPAGAVGGRGIGLAEVVAARAARRC